MKAFQIPTLAKDEITDGIKQAVNSERKRYAKILHEPGAEFNEVFNFTQYDSYMQPHLHPSNEKIEYIHIIEGRVAVLFFDNTGEITECTILDNAGTKFIEVPAFTWHTYVMLTENVITYETMMGVYKTETWKKFAKWAPFEDTLLAKSYLGKLKLYINKDLR